MVQFRSYNLYVHGSFKNEGLFMALGGINRDQDGNLHDVAGYVRNPDSTISAPPPNPTLDPLRRMAVAGFDLIEDNSPQAKEYEQRVLPLLRTIEKSTTGGAILNNMGKRKKVIIVPYNSFDKLSAGECNARSMNRMSFGGYIRVAFTPDVACTSDNREYPSSEDETLLHELFHAYLMSVDKDGDYYEKMKESSSQEEFLAVQITNMYRSEIGRGTFQRVYGAGSGPTKQPTVVTRRQLEEYFQSDEEVLNVLKPDGVGLFTALAKSTTLPLNPFRNWGQYQQKLTEFRYRVKQDLQRAGKPIPRITPIWE